MEKIDKVNLWRRETILWRTTIMTNTPSQFSSALEDTEK